MDNNMKIEFGKRLRVQREKKGFSRASLGLRLGISPKTIQSWENGRTFIENLSLIPALEAELDASISALITDAIAAMDGKAAASPRERKVQSRAGPIVPAFALRAERIGCLPAPAALADEFVAVPIVKSPAAAQAVAGLAPRDIVGHVIIPGDWVPRGGVMVAFRAGDNGLAPRIPLGATVIVDRRSYPPAKVLDRLMAFWVRNKGLRLRRLARHPRSRRLLGVSSLETRRGTIVFRPDKGDLLLGRIVGVLAPVE
jgi:transcriptional regulator with XRE-family HTH domain